MQPNFNNSNNNNKSFKKNKPKLNNNQIIKRKANCFRKIKKNKHKYKPIS